MKSRTDTNCKECIHKNICVRVNRPGEIVAAISNFNPCDDNGIDIVISCIDFEKALPRPKLIDFYKEVKNG